MNFARTFILSLLIIFSVTSCTPPRNANSVCADHTSHAPFNASLIAEQVLRNSSVIDKVILVPGDHYMTSYHEHLRYHTVYVPQQGTRSYSFGCLFCIAALYHEMGHIVNNDGFWNAQIEQGITSAKQVMNEPEFVADVARIDYYTNLGKQALAGNITEPVLKKIAAHRNDILWNRPNKQEDYEYILFCRNKEKRADLYALDQLWKHGLIDAIRARITVAEILGHKCDNLNCRHPSSIERSLYSIGFLVEKGVDINALFSSTHSTQTIMQNYSSFATTNYYNYYHVNSKLITRFLDYMQSHRLLAQSLLYAMVTAGLAFACAAFFTSYV